MEPLATLLGGASGSDGGAAMKGKTLRVQTGSRLHFGLMELHQGSSHCFAGMGAMVESPGLVLELATETSSEKSDRTSGTPRIECSQNLIDRTNAVVQRVTSQGQLTRLPDSIRFVSELPLHCGLGAGTQTACALTLALTEFDRGCDKRVHGESELHAVDPREPAEESQATRLASEDMDAMMLSKLAGRGRRSAIGLQGILSGGLVLDHGYQASSETAANSNSVVNSSESNTGGVSRGRTVQVQAVTPTHPFHVVLIFSPPEHVYAGQVEASIIDRLGESPNPKQSEMMELATRAYAAFGKHDVVEFGQLLDQYMLLASDLFAAGQGGMYVSETVESIVQAAKRAGLLGVGQSSWGPTVFGFCENATQVPIAVDQLRETLPQECSVVPTQVASNGGRMDWLSCD
ncbi:MAG: hypothetical protein AAGG44_13360 [Planctomycetota bacterium]